MIIRTRAYPRAGLVGNPSDGYFGKTIAFVFGNFAAEVVLYQTPELEILPNTRDASLYQNMKHLVEDVRQYGYYGGIRLLKATVTRFYEYCRDNDIELDDRNFTIRYDSNIPHQVGLGGSSAIVTACVRALRAFYQVHIPKAIQSNLVLSVEREELAISAGLQDRVAQTYEGMVYMDFGKDIMDKQGYGRYTYLDKDLLPPIYIAYDAELAEGSGVFHNHIRERFDRGDSQVVEAMKYWAGLTDQVKDCMVKGDRDGVSGLLDANFDKRNEIYRISARNVKMIEVARSTGASAKFSGSGGAIVGTYKDEEGYRKLEAAFKPLNIQVIKPVFVDPDD